MAIKRRFTQTPLRKELQTLADLPNYGDAYRVLSREGKFFASDYEAAESLKNDIRDVFEDKAYFSEPNNPRKEGRYVLTPDNRDEIEGLVEKLFDMVSHLEDQLTSAEERLDAYQETY